MSTITKDDLDTLAEKADQAAALLRMLANERRLLVLCRLAAGETSVNALAQAVGLSQSALSQHLALMRAEGLVATRRDGQTIYYRIADAAAEQLLGTLKDIYCGPGKATS